MLNFAQTARHRLQILWLGWLLLTPFICLANDGFHAGFIYDKFPLTLESGSRAEALGPFFYNQQTDTEHTWAVPPIFSHNANPAIESREEDFCYPILTYERYGREYRWQFFELFSFAGGQRPDTADTHRFTLFPIYFQQRSADTNLNYTAAGPFYGHLYNRMFRDEIFYIMFPIYGQSRKKDVVTDNYFYPFFHLRHGEGLHGWQLWPIVGKEHKDATTETNGFGDVTTIGGHENFFALWPFYISQKGGIGTDNPEKFVASFPFFAATHAPQRDATSVLWPFFTRIDDREKKYREWQGPWPFVIFTRGEGKTTSRVWPLFSRSHNQTLESDSYLWPIYRHKEFHAPVVDQTRDSIFFYVFADLTEKNKETGAKKKRVAAWPFFIWTHEFNGNEQLRIPALVEPALPGNRGVERNWAPIWSLWRSEKNPRAGASNQSLLWNFYRRDTSPGVKKCSLMFGLFQYQSTGETKRLRLFYIPVIKTHSPAAQPAK